MTTPQTPGQVNLAHEIWALAQLAPGEGIEDAVARIAAAITPGSPCSAVGEREALKSCPFCGDYAGELAESAVPNALSGGQKRAVYCNACFCEGPTANTDEAAHAAWNRRAAISAPAAEQQADALAQACDLLSSTIGTLMSYRQKIGYVDKSPIAALVREAVEFLLPWPEKMPSAAPVVQAAGQPAGVLGGYPAKPDSDHTTVVYGQRKAWFREDQLLEFADATVAHRAQQAGAGLGDDMAECDLQFVESVVSGIATRQYGLASNSEGAAPVSDIRTASKLAQAALPRLRRAIAALYTADALRAKVEPSAAEISALWMNTPVRDDLSLVICFARALLALQGAKLADARAPAVGSGVEFAGWQERHRVHQGEWSAWAEVAINELEYRQRHARDNPHYNQIRQVFAAPIEAQAQKGGADHG